mmetsp:Transcript_19882/g.32628  ORF Transcript_19882/g.32628 Transcript_19882/m.32628 type:complete len:256 (-) Transcript_19882:487-1254(-)
MRSRIECSFPSDSSVCLYVYVVCVRSLDVSFVVYFFLFTRLSLTIKNPTERLQLNLVILLLIHASLSQLLVSLWQTAYILLLLLCLGGQSGQVTKLPMIDKMLNNFRIVNCGVYTKSLSDSTKVLVQLGILSIGHEFSRHDDLSTHHIPKFHKKTIWITLQNLGTEALVGLLVTSLVTSNLGTDALEVLGTIFFSNLANISMGDLGGTFLERSVEKATVGVLTSAGVESTGNKMLNGNLNCTHVRLSTEVKVLIQ